jgi:hypothetical protein
MKDILQPVVRKFLPYAKEKMGFDDAPSIYLRTDPKNSESIFGKTAHYDPNERSVVLYVHNRHPKDVLRSLSHELVHHAQNCRGEFDGQSMAGEQGYAQKDPHLRKMEEEAYSVGNLVFRDFEDMMKEKTIYREFLEKGETLDMSHEKWRNKELGTLLSESWGFGFDLNRLTESEDVVKEGSCAGKRDCPGCPECQPMEEGEMPMKTDTEDADEDGDTTDKVPAFLDKGETKKKKSKGKQPPQLAAAQGKKKEKDDKEKIDEIKLRRVIRSIIRENTKTRKMDPQEAQLRRVIRSLAKETIRKG